MMDDGNAEDENLPEKYLDWPMMFYFDELPQLGYMRIIEPEPEPEEPPTADADLASDAEYQAELAALQARMRARKTAGPPASPTSISREEGARTPERPVESSEPPRRPPAPPNFDE